VNVIVIMEDSLRKDHLGCYGNRWIRTPNIDRFASEGIIFDSAYAEGLPTIPVRVSLLTGRYTLPFRGWQPMEQMDVPVAEVLWDKGYTTALISDTYHMHKPRMGFARGFDYVQWIRGQETDPYITDPGVEVDLSRYSGKNWHPAYPGQPERLVQRDFEKCLRNTAHWRGEEDQLIAQVLTAGMEWLERQVSGGRRDRLLLWLDSFDPHEPWDPPSPYREMYAVPDYDGPLITWGGGFIEDWTPAEVRHIRAQYAGKVTLCDTWTGRFFERLGDLGLLDNTLIILLSDHGEPLGEHGIVKKVQPWPYDELSRIPFIVRLPDGEEGGKRLDAFVGMPDVMPTCLDFLGVEGPKVVQGKTVLPLIRGEAEGMSFGVSGFHGRSQSIRNREWSYYEWLGIQMARSVKQKPELYRLDRDFTPPKPAKYQRERDQAERENLIDKEPEMAKSLAQQLKKFIEGLSPSPGDLMAKAYMQRMGAPPG